MTRRRPHRTDALIAAALAIPSLVQVLVAPIAPRPVGVLIALANTVPIAWRRMYPAAAAVTAAAAWCLHIDGYIVLGYVAAFILFYSLGAHAPDRHRVIGVCAFAIASGVVGTTLSHPVAYSCVTAVFIVAGPALVGRVVRRQQDQSEAGCASSRRTSSASGGADRARRGRRGARPGRARAARRGGPRRERDRHPGRRGRGEVGREPAGGAGPPATIGARPRALEDIRRLFGVLGRARTATSRGRPAWASSTR